ncbi:helix-turn-helix domain-containing protein [Streptococcus suis]
MYRRLRDMREDSDYSQEFISNYLSCSQSFYSRIESGTRELPVDILIKLSNLYSVSTEYLLHLTDFRKRIQK